ncbi:MAG TPA: hypothetical protein VL625_00125, partial [Patescibacteria group bacterium]|nr:hypothetical protein [Patescibacteria group bacterium]
QKAALDTRIGAWLPSEPSIKQKDLVDLPWILCNSEPDEGCKATLNGNVAEVHCAVDSLACHDFIEINTNQLQRRNCAPY